MIECSRKITNAQLSSGRCQEKLEHAMQIFNATSEYSTDVEVYQSMLPLLKALKDDLEFAAKELQQCVIHNTQRNPHQYKGF